jgi:hypothetical protein
MSHAFSRLPISAGLPRIRFHDLRHTAATLMLANGEHPKIVQERLGHSDGSMTLNRYSHVTMDMQRDAADRPAKLLSSESDQFVTNARSRPLRTLSNQGEVNIGAEGGGRTLTSLRTTVFETVASAIPPLRPVGTG